MGVAEDFGTASDRVGVADFCVESIFVGAPASRPDSVFEGILTSSVLGSLISVSGRAEGSALDKNSVTKRQRPVHPLSKTVANACSPNLISWIYDRIEDPYAVEYHRDLTILIGT